MPLQKSSSKKAFKENVRAEIEAGKPQIKMQLYLVKLNV